MTQHEHKVIAVGTKVRTPDGFGYVIEIEGDKFLVELSAKRMKFFPHRYFYYKLGQLTPQKV